jgi:hypothetical protein
MWPWPPAAASSSSSSSFSTTALSVVRTSVCESGRRCRADLVTDQDAGLEPILLIEFRDASQPTGVVLQARKGFLKAVEAGP